MLSGEIQTQVVPNFPNIPDWVSSLCPSSAVELTKFSSFFFEYADFWQIFGQRSCFLGPRKIFIQKSKYSLIKAGQAVLRVCFHYMENVLDLSKMLWILMMLVKRIVISNLDLNIITDWQILKIPRYLQKIFTLKLHHHGTICRLRK